MDQNPNQNPDALEILMAETAEKLNAKRAEEAKVQKAQPVSIDQIGELFALQSAKIDAQIAKAIADRTQEQEDAPVSKAVGRKGTVAGTQTSSSKGLRDENPLQYIVSKARSNEDSDKPAHQTFDVTDKAIIWALTRKALANGMVNEATDDEQEIDLDNL